VISSYVETSESEPSTTSVTVEVTATTEVSKTTAPETAASITANPSETKTKPDSSKIETTATEETVSTIEQKSDVEIAREKLIKTLENLGYINITMNYSDNDVFSGMADMDYRETRWDKPFIRYSVDFTCSYDSSNGYEYWQVSYFDNLYNDKLPLSTPEGWAPYSSDLFIDTLDGQEDGRLNLGPNDPKPWRSLRQGGIEVVPWNGE
jgi:hypothetical protein